MSGNNGDTGREVLIKTEELWKTYVMGAEEIHALQGVSFQICRGEYVAIMGPSGSGKSTMMNLIGCLDTPSKGNYFLNSRLVSDMNDDELAHIRNKEIGFVFQTFNLLARATALHNVELPLIYNGTPSHERKERAMKALQAVELGDRMYHKPNELSGGQRQRVGVARALGIDPPILLMDEPFGALDPITRSGLHAEFVRIQSRIRKTVIIVTHDVGEAFALGDRIGVLEAGTLVACDRPDALRRSTHPAVRGMLDAVTRFV